MSFCVFALVLWVLLKVKTPRYRVQAYQIKNLLEMILCGQASSNDWNLFLAFEIRDNDYLDSIRQRCIEIDLSEFRDNGTNQYLFTSKGLGEIRELLSELNATLNEESRDS